MKTKNLVTILAIAGFTLFFSSCSETINEVDDSFAFAEKSAQLQVNQGDDCTYDGILSEEEKAGLLKMREEEKMAYDVYMNLFEVHGEVIFETIAKSEAKHESAVLSLLNGYLVTYPELSNPGEFSIPEIQALYEAFVAQGSASLAEALKVGAEIEDFDIFDLVDLLEVTENEDVERVYGNLLSGSENHLRAFTNSLTLLGETYSPKYISVTLYEEILAASNSSKGKKGNGNSSYGNSSNGKSGNGKGSNGNGSNGDGSNGDGTCTEDGTNTQGNGDGTPVSNGNSNGNTDGNGNGNSGSNGNGNGNGK